MKIFPHILSRVGGLEFDLTTTLSYQNMDFVNVLLEKEQLLEIQKLEILNFFQDAFQKSGDYRFRAILLNAKKDFSNYRFSFLKKIIKNAKDEKDTEAIQSLKNRIEIFQTKLADFEKTKIDFQIDFQNELKPQIKFLQKLSQNENFQKGILQSSQSFYQRVQSFQTKPIENFRKKEMQTARSICQYFYRIAAKSSPFSYFTTLDILNEKDDLFFSKSLPATSNNLQFNNFLLVEIQNQLLKIPSFFLQLPVELNSTIRVENNEFVFLKNEKNVETIQRIESSEVLVLLQNNIFTKSKKFGSIVNELEELIEAERNDLVNFLLEIIETGFVEWSWKITPLDLDWEVLFLNWLKKIENFVDKNLWVAFLEKLIDWKKNYKIGDSKKRFSIQKIMSRELEKMKILNFPNELIFFEDVRISRNQQLEKNKIKPIIGSLNVLLNWLEPFSESGIKRKIKNLWEANFDKKQKVPLLDFYETFYKTDFSKIKNVQKVQNFDASYFEKNISMEDGIIQFSTLDIQNSTSRNSSKSYAGLFQFFEKNASSLNAVINGVAPGYGKLFGRFLPLFEEQLYETIKIENGNLNKNLLSVENTDGSIFNANQHLPLLNKEIKIPNGQNQLFFENQISLKDLEVIWDEKMNEPILFFSKSKKQVQVFDFGFEHPSNRSPLFQLLNAFQIPWSTFRIFTKKINETFVEKRENEILIFPRIVVDSHLILQRKFMEVPVSFFPKKLKNETRSQYFYKIQKWKKEEKIDRHVFIQPIKNSRSDFDFLKKDFFKPQYFDLESPFAIILLQKIIEKQSGRIKIIEMLPSPSDISAQKYIIENVVQWKSLAEH